MADTGAPWNIPYVENADLVKDYPTASLALANAIADGLDAASNAGIGSNVVQTVKTDVFTTTSGSYVDVTGLAVTITPTSATSKILVFLDVSISSPNTRIYLRLVRDSTDLYIGTGGATENGTQIMDSDGTVLDRIFADRTITYLDSPATTSAVTYKATIKANAGGTAYVNRWGLDNNQGVPSSITVIEVAA